ncbi:MAG: hypothetical protein ABSG17_05090 [Spirochaetia bacterium]
MGVCRGRLEWRNGSGPASLGGSEVHVWKVPAKPTGDREAVREELLILVGRYMAVAPGDLQFVIGEYGKPALDPLRHVSAIEFNVSHSHGLGLIALAKNRLVGIDIEKHRGNAGVEAVGRDFLRLPADAGAVDFYAAWTRREAGVKARGGSIVLSRGVPPGADGEWQLIDLAVGDGFSAALCYSGTEAEVFLWSPAAGRSAAGFIASRCSASGDAP